MQSKEAKYEKIEAANKSQMKLGDAENKKLIQLVEYLKTILAQTIVTLHKL